MEQAAMQYVRFSTGNNRLRFVLLIQGSPLSN